MLPSAIIARARRLSGNYTTDDDDCYDILSAVRDLIYSEIVLKDRSYQRDRRYADSVLDQSEYTILWVSGTTPGQRKIENIGIKYASTDDYFTPCTERSFEELDKDTDILRYKTNQSKDDPFYIIADDSIFIFPTPTVAVTNGIKFEGIRQPAPLSSSSVEADIRLPYEMHFLLPLWVASDLFKERQLINEKNDNEAEFKRKLDTLLDEVSIRSTKPAYWERPDNSNLV